MDRDQIKSLRKISAHDAEQNIKKGHSSVNTKKMGSTTSSSSLIFDSSSDVGYKSGDLDSGKFSCKAIPTDVKSQSLKKEQSMRFDSGLGSDVFSPLSSETDIACPVEDEALSTKSVSKQRPEERLIWHDIYTQDQDGDTILHLAVVEARSDIIFPLIRQAPHPDFLDICNDLCQTPLHLSTLMGKSNIVRRLVAAGATLDIQDHHGNTALHIASRNGDLDCVHALLEPLTQEEIEDAQCLYDVYPQPNNLTHLLNLKNYEGQTSIHLASMGGFKKVLECLCDHGANVNDKEGKSGKTALHFAVENINYELVQILVSKCHAKVNEKNYAGQTPVHVAWTLCKRNRQRLHLSILEFLKRASTERWESPSDSESTSADEG